MIQTAGVCRSLGLMALLLVVVTPEARGYCDNVAGGGEPFEQQALAEINALRQSGTVCRGVSIPPRAPLTMDSRLQCAARNHSMDMATQGFFSHENPNEPDERTAGKRAFKAGFPKQPTCGWPDADEACVLENIAAGSPTPAAVVHEAWAKSSGGHCEAMMSENDVIGIGFAQAADGTPYWTAVISK